MCQGVTRRTWRKAQVLPLLQPHFFPFRSATLLLLLAWPEQAAAVFQLSCAGFTALPSTLKAQLLESCQPHSFPLSSYTLLAAVGTPEHALASFQVTGAH